MFATGIITGSSMAVVAMLEVISVRKLTAAIMTSNAIILLLKENTSNCSPIHLSNSVF